MGTVITLPRELFSAEAQKWTYLRVKRIASSKPADLAGLCERQANKSNGSFCVFQAWKKLDSVVGSTGGRHRCRGCLGRRRSASDPAAPAPRPSGLGHRQWRAVWQQGRGKEVLNLSGGASLRLRRFRNPRFSSLTGEEQFLL